MATAAEGRRGTNGVIALVKVGGRQAKGVHDRVWKVTQVVVVKAGAFLRGKKKSV